MNFSNNTAITIDGRYIKEKLACGYLVIEGQEAAFIETCTNFSVPFFLNELKRHNLKEKDVKYIIITHVHLDHAGGAGLLMQKCPNATLLAHPKAAKHMINPSRLIQSSVEVYGEENFKKLYGDIIPIDENRVKIPDDGEILEWGERKLKFIYTKGHASHHFVIYDSKLNGVFTGDSFGIAYPVMQEKGLFIYPTTTPTDFDPQEARISIDKILNTGCDKVFLTHFGTITQLEEAKEQLLEGLNFFEEQLNKCKNSQLSTEELQKKIKEEIMQFFKNKMKKINLEETPERNEMLDFDAELNSMGVVYAAKRYQKAT